MSVSVPNVKLNSGCYMPLLGLGTYKSQKGEIHRAIKDAIEVGYRHIDCAHMYGNEREIGDAIAETMKSKQIRRADLFITSKLWNTYHKKDMVVPAIKKSLKNLGLDYLDLYLIHWPYAFKEGDDPMPREGSKVQYSDVDYLQTWLGMEECVKLGLTKSIGVSNFNSKQLQRLLDSCKVPPACNQIECNPGLQQIKFTEFCRARNIAVVGFCPLGRPSQTSGVEGKPQSALLNEGVKKIAKKKNKTEAQVVLRYLISLGVAVIPKSVTKSRIQENINIFDFELDEDDVSYIKSLNQNLRVCPSTEFQDHQYYPFNIEF